MLAYVHRALVRHGPIKLAQIAASQLRDRIRRPPLPAANDDFDRRYGTDTAAKRSLSSLSDLDPRQADVRDANAYQASGEDFFHRILRKVPVNFNDFTFVDLGSGKGRTLLIAASLPFRRIIGVEFSAELHQIAQRNIAIFPDGDKVCQSVTSVHASATTYRLPAEPLVVYLYNPFGLLTLRDVIAHLIASYDQQPRSIFIVYANSSHSEVLLEHPKLLLCWRESDTLICAVRDDERDLG